MSVPTETVKGGKSMKTLTAEVEGATTHDLVLALEELVRQVNLGYGSGFDENEDGNYSYSIKNIETEIGE